MCGVSLIFQILCCLMLVGIPDLLYNDRMVDTMASCGLVYRSYGSTASDGYKKDRVQ